VLWLRFSFLWMKKAYGTRSACADSYLINSVVLLAGLARLAAYFLLAIAKRK
jgi:hypothetical protein